MQLEIKTEGVDFVVPRAPQPKNDAEDRPHTWQSGASADLISLGTPDHGVTV